MTIGPPYFTYTECRHALGHAHHLRELQCMAKQFEQAWANAMAELLLELKTAVEDTRARAARLPLEWLEAFDRRYDAIVQDGCAAHPGHPHQQTLERPKNEAVRNKRPRVTS
jgi:hypothetical protein